ncbi:arginase family protein [Flagellimonas sp.]|uniref:arginase family protein n=1 Tax=Flagellimonas sp. TaxID=2058762 RepID=UPI003BAF4A32
MKQRGEFGLFFLDGHTDFITPELSDTGGAAGMDLAIVTGHGHDKLTNILGLKPNVKEENVFCVGNRECDPKYVHPILESDIHYFDLKRFRNNGLKQTAEQFLEMVETHNLDGFLIHLDADVLNDDIMPAVDSREADGLLYHELAEILIPLLLSTKAIGMEITILDPNLDSDGTYTTEFVRNLTTLLNQGKNSG